MKGIRTALLCLLLLCGCGGRAVTAAEALAELAEHCDVPYALGSPLAESEDMWSGQGRWADYRHTPGWGCFSLENNDVRFEMGGWPDVQDPYHVVRFQLKTGRYALFGLRVGCSREEAEQVLTRRGYTAAAENEESRGYTKGEIWLGVRWDRAGMVTRFTASIPSTNVEDVVF